MFKRWCSDQGFLNTRPITHVMMDGGVLSVPFDRLNDFYRVYVQCIKSGEHVFIVEQKTDYYNFFLDIDYNDDEALGLEQVKGIVDVICTKVESLNSGTTCLVSVAKPKPKGEGIKTGIHLNWPGLVVDQEQAIHLMSHVVSTLDKVYSAHDWSKTVDTSVYGDPGTKGSGFRLPWSHKKGKHAECKGQGCLVCDRTGKLTEGEYLPIFIFDKTILSATTQEPTVEKLWMATVRTNTDKVICQPIPEVPKKRKKEGDFTAAQTKNEVENNELLAYLETFVRSHMDGQSCARIQKIFKHKDTFLLKTNSRWCENIRREHHSNHIWFLIQDSIIYQKCFCRCETMEGRRTGFCKDFSGRKHQLSKRITDILYPINNKNASVHASSDRVSAGGSAYARACRAAK